MTQPEAFLPGAQKSLSSRTSEAIGRNPDRRTGTVLSFLEGELSVQVAGGQVFRAGYLDSYQPVIGDVVSLVLQRSTWLVLGRLEDNLGGGAPIGGLLGGVRWLTFANVLVTNSGVQQLVPEYLITVPVRAGNLIAVRAQFRARSQAATTAAPSMQIREGTSATDPSIFAEYAQLQHSPTHNHAINNFTSWHRPSVTGMQSYVLTMSSPNGVTYEIAHGGGDSFVVINYGAAPGVTP